MPNKIYSHSVKFKIQFRVRASDNHPEERLSEDFNYGSLNEAISEPFLGDE